MSSELEARKAPPASTFTPLLLTEIIEHWEKTGAWSNEPGGEHGYFILEKERVPGEGDFSKPGAHLFEDLPASGIIADTIGAAAAEGTAVLQGVSVHTHVRGGGIVEGAMAERGITVPPSNFQHADYYAFRGTPGTPFTYQILEVEGNAGAGAAPGLECDCYNSHGEHVGASSGVKGVPEAPPFHPCNFPADGILYVAWHATFGHPPYEYKVTAEGVEAGDLTQFQLPGSFLYIISLEIGLTFHGAAETSGEVKLAIDEEIAGHSIEIASQQPYFFTDSSEAPPDRHLDFGLQISPYILPGQDPFGGVSVLRSDLPGNETEYAWDTIRLYIQQLAM